MLRSNRSYTGTAEVGSWIYLLLIGGNSVCVIQGARNNHHLYSIVKRVFFFFLVPSTFTHIVSENHGVRWIQRKHFTGVYGGSARNTNVRWSIRNDDDECNGKQCPKQRPMPFGRSSDFWLSFVRLLVRSVVPMLLPPATLSDSNTRLVVIGLCRWTLQTHLPQKDYRKQKNLTKLTSSEKRFVQTNMILFPSRFILALPISDSKKTPYYYFPLLQIHSTYSLDLVPSVWSKKER